MLLVTLLSLATSAACGGVGTAPLPTETARASATTGTGPSGTSAPDAGPTLFWASYEFHDEPKFRLLFEGGVPTSSPAEIRIVDASGKVVAASSTVPVESDPLRLCARSTRYGTVRAMIPVGRTTFDAFIVDPSKFVVEVRMDGQWARASLTNLCHVTQ